MALHLTLFPQASSSSTKNTTTTNQNNNKLELKVCVNRSCSRQGSRETLAILSAIASPSVAVASCGCLGRCGAGPNIAVLPRGVIVGHCGTATKAVELLGVLCGSGFDAERNLQAFVARKKGEEELESGNAAAAEELFSQAIDLEPSGGLHFIYRSRSMARLVQGNHAGALEDAREASRLAPEYTESYICQGDVLFAMGDYDAAEKAYSTALMLDPSIRHSKSFKARVSRLQEKLVTAHDSP